MFPFSRKTSWNYYRPRHTMRQIAATRHGDKSPRLHCCCDQSLALSLSLRYVAQIQTSLNLCDRSQRRNSVAATMIFTRHTRRFVAATCRGNVSQQFVASCVSALIAAKCQDILQLNLVLLTSGKSFLLCYRAKVIPVQWLSSCLLPRKWPFANLVIELKCQNVEHLPFGILETTVKKWSSKPYLLFAAILWTHMAFQSRAMSHWNVM